MIDRLFDLLFIGAFLWAVTPGLQDRADRWAKARERGALPDEFFRTMGPRL